MIDLIRYDNEWPWGWDALFIFKDGLGTVGVSFEPNCDFGFIHDLVVHETARKEGRGQYLLRTAELAIMKRCRKYSVLRVVPGSWMQDWYARNGYEIWGGGASTPGNIEMRKFLW